MQEINDPTATGGLLGWAVGALVTAALAVPRVLKFWSADRAGRLSNDAQADIVTGLRSELQRLRQDGAAMAADFEKLRADVVRLSQENLDLKLEVHALRARITMMSSTNNQA